MAAAAAAMSRGKAAVTQKTGRGPCCCTSDPEK
jgi:hypothetical protein